MLSFFFNDANTTFLFAICIVIGIGLLEGVGSLIGLGFSTMLDDVLSIDSDIDGSVATTGGVTAILGWLGIGKVPFLIWLVMLLTSYAIIGFSVVFAYLVITGFNLSPLFSIPCTMVITTLFTRKATLFLGKVIPKNESSAISESEFAGCVATITRLDAKIGQPTEAKFKDRFNQTHYVLVEPDKSGTSFPCGSQVLLLKKKEGTNFWIASEL